MPRLEGRWLLILCHCKLIYSMATAPLSPRNIHTYICTYTFFFYSLTQLYTLLYILLYMHYCHKRTSVYIDMYVELETTQEAFTHGVYSSTHTILWGATKLQYIYIHTYIYTLILSQCIVPCLKRATGISCCVRRFIVVALFFFSSI